ncbi:MarC family protein [Roseomonas chloroacetimidivorans]|uniref:MarC family protein n=1 Tax=Roseomonas chloroacetimidivorans TaxID=1766656 RepID=UPI003C75281D
MKDIAATSFATLFATIGPLEVASVFALLAGRTSAQLRRRLAITSCGIATLVLVAFAFGGAAVLDWLSIGLPAFTIAGAVLLLLLAIDLVFARPSGLSSLTPGEEREAEGNRDIAVVPLAIPLIAGPGSMAAVVLLMDRAHSASTVGIVLLMLTLVMGLTLAAMLAAGRLMRLLGVAGVNVVARVSGVLLAALAVQFMLDGLQAVGLISAARPALPPELGSLG